MITTNFFGPVTGSAVNFSVYLPPEYDTTTNRFPVVYHLHPLGGSFAGSLNTNSIPASLEAAVNNGAIDPCIIVFPDGYNNSAWADSVGSFKPCEINIIQELIPHVDRSYRTIPSRSRRVVQGFGLGGFGAAKFAAKFPDHFCGCVIYDGALHDWSSLTNLHPDIATEIFGDDESRFDEYSPWRWLVQNGPTLAGSVVFRQVIGGATEYNQSWRVTMHSNNVAGFYTETTCSADLQCMLNVAGQGSWAFIKGAFAAADGPQFAIPTLTNGVVQLSWSSRSNIGYQVQISSNLTQWADVGEVAVAPGTNTFWQDNSSGGTLPGSVGERFYRLRRIAFIYPPPMFTFAWSGVDWTFVDNQLFLTGIMLKPSGSGPFPGVVLSHGLNSSAESSGLTWAQEMVQWGLVCIAPNYTHVDTVSYPTNTWGDSPENRERAKACFDVLASLPYVNTNYICVYGGSAGAMLTIGLAGRLTNQIAVAAVSAGGIASTTNSIAHDIRAPLLMQHGLNDTNFPPSGVPVSWATNLQVVLSANGVPNRLITYPGVGHNLSSVSSNVLSEVRKWFWTNGVPIIPP